MLFEKLTESQRAAIAEVAVASSELEAELERSIIELCKLWWPHGAVLLDNVRVEAKLNILQSLIDAEFNGKPLVAEFKAVFDSLKSLNSQRNTIIHGNWVTKSWTQEFVDWKPGQHLRDIEQGNIVAHRNKRGKQPPAVSAQKVKKVADLIELNRRLLHQLFWEHFPDRVAGLSGLPESKTMTSDILRELIRKRTAQKT